MKLRWVGLSLFAVCLSAGAQPVPSAVQATAKTLLGDHFYTCRDSVLFGWSPGSLRSTAYGSRVSNLAAATELTVIRVAVVSYTPVPGHSGYRINALLQESGSTDRYVAAAFYYPSDLASGVLSGFGGASDLRDEQIAHVSIEKGQPLSDLECVMGRPERTNDYGDSFEQLVFDGGRMLVYVNPRREEVVGVQRFGE